MIFLFTPGGAIPAALFNSLLYLLTYLLAYLLTYPLTIPPQAVPSLQHGAIDSARVKGEIRVVGTVAVPVQVS